jgi:hypothetical protein
MRNYKKKEQTVYEKNQIDKLITIIKVSYNPKGIFNIYTHEAASILNCSVDDVYYVTKCARKKNYIKLIDHYKYFLGLSNTYSIEPKLQAILDSRNIDLQDKTDIMNQLAQKKYTYIPDNDYFKDLVSFVNSECNPLIYKLNAQIRGNELHYKGGLLTKWKGKGKNKRKEFTGRIYNNLCLTKSMKEGKEYDKKDKRESRYDMMNRLGYHNYKEVYDIKGEIPRVTHLLNTGEWWEDTFDPYAAMIEKSRLKLSNNARGARDIMKFLFMYIYFAKGTDRQVYSWYCKKLRNKYITVNKLKDKQENGRYKNKPGAWDKTKKNTVIPISLEDWPVMKQAVYKVLDNRFYGNEIFFWTSTLELMIMDYMFPRYKCLQVYDALYGAEEIENIGDMIKNIACDFYNNVYQKYVTVSKKQKVTSIIDILKKV